MTNAQHAKRIVDAVKARMRKEKSPVQRYALAILGNEFNELYMQLNGPVDNPILLLKKCSKCKNNKPVEDFDVSRRSYTRKDGSVAFYEYQRPDCKLCQHPRKTNRSKYLK